MTQIRARIALTLSFAVLVGGFALIAALLMPAAGSAARVAAPVAVAAHRISLELPARPQVAASDDLVGLTLGTGTDYTQAQADEISQAGDRVCEGFRAGVPVVEMERTLVAAENLTDVQAHQFVLNAHTLRCPAA